MFHVNEQDVVAGGGGDQRRRDRAQMMYAETGRDLAGQELAAGMVVEKLHGISSGLRGRSVRRIGAWVKITPSQSAPISRVSTVTGAPRRK